MTFYLRLEVVAKKDTMICNLDVKDPLGSSTSKLQTGIEYTLQCELYEAAIGGCLNPVKTPVSTPTAVQFYINGVQVGVSSVRDGKASVTFTPSESDVGDKTLKAVFPGDDRYNASSAQKSITIQTVGKTGFNVTVVDPPPNGKVVTRRKEGAVLYVPIKEYPIGTEGRVFIDTTDLAYLLVGEMYIEVQNAEGYIMSRISKSKPPDNVVVDVTLYGYTGAQYRAVVTTSTTSVASDTPFKIYATMYQASKDPSIDPFSERLPEDSQVDFYGRPEDGEWQKIGSNKTDAAGIAVLQTSVTLPPDVTQQVWEYKAGYAYGDTYSDISTVTVSFKPGFLDQIINSVAQLLNIPRDQAEIVVKGLAGLLVVVFLISLLRG